MLKLRGERGKNQQSLQKFQNPNNQFCGKERNCNNLLAISISTSLIIVIDAMANV